MRKLQILWVDLTVALTEAEIPPEFDKHCEIIHSSEPDDVELTLERRPVEAVCFNFDYPDRAGLRLLRDTKVAHPSLPAIMLTVQHSEALAIWAFRTRVWDFLVKPVSRYEAERSLVGLMRALGLRKSQERRPAAMHMTKIPDEVSYARRPEGSSLAPAVFYVEKHFRSKIRSEDVAALCGLSPFRLSRAFKETFGLTFRDYLVGYRLKEACRLLENPAATVTDVAYAVGFNDASYFTRVFKQRMGIAPSLLVGRSLSEAERQEGLPSLPELPDILL